MKRLAPYALYLAWLPALFSLLISLYLGEGLGWPVCALCWYQRIALYPLALLLGIAAYRADPHIIPYSWPFVMINALIAAIQYIEQLKPTWYTLSVCHMGASCTEIVWQWGFITLPFLSFCISVWIGYWLWVAAQQHRLS